MQNDVFDRSRILNLTILLEGALLLVAACWIQLAQLDIVSEFVLTRKVALIGVLGGVTTAVSGFAILFVGRLFRNSIKMINTLREIIHAEVAPLFKDLNFADIVLIAASSGFCEEAFFRGVMQVQIGLIPTSIIFGMVHCPIPPPPPKVPQHLKPLLPQPPTTPPSPRWSLPRYLPYGLWAAGAGLFLGFLRDYTGSVWAPIIAHGLSNLIVIIYLRYFLKVEPPEPKKVG
jgi:membrane protease YdiL (CAAX protease family)